MKLGKWMQTEPSIQSHFQKENFGSSGQRLIKNG